MKKPSSQLIAEAVQAERERIIKLLGEDVCEPDDWFEMRYDHLIALIKGENNE